MEGLGVEYDTTYDRMSFGRRFAPDSSEYRMQKEIFVREHNGSSPTEVAALVAFIAVRRTSTNALFIQLLIIETCSSEDQLHLLLCQC